MKKKKDKTKDQLEEEISKLRRKVTKLERTEAVCKWSEEEIQHNYDIQSVTNSILHFSLKDIPFEKLLKKALDLILSISWLTFESKGCIFLVEESADVLTMKAQSGISKQLQKRCEKIPFGECICGQAALTRKIQFVDHLDERHHIHIRNVAPHGHYCVPMLFGGKVLGVINIYIKEGHQYNKKEEEFLASVADTLSGVIRRKQAEKGLRESFERLQKNMTNTIHAMAKLVETRDPYTAGHQKRVSQLVCAIAREMGFSDEKISQIRVAAAIHDIGKICVPAEILSKPGRLSEIEFGLIKHHPQAGYNILKEIEFPLLVTQTVLQHQERLNGSGYPKGISEKDIILEARILGVADAVEAMSSHRPHRPALSLNKALETVSKKKGILYDPKVVDVCVRLFVEKKFQFD